MAVCRNCGAPLEDGVCARCGATQNGSPPVGSPESPAISDNIASALCYVLLLVTGILFLLLEPYKRNRRVRFHAFQSIFVNVAIIVLWVAISVFAKSLALLLSPLFLLVCLFLWVFLIWKALQNQTVILPLIGPIAEKQA